MADGIDFDYWIAKTIANVNYDSRYRFNRGANWTIRYRCGEENPVENMSYSIPPDCSFMCNNMLYSAGDPPSGIDAYDVIDDAIYRLLDEKLDIDPKDSYLDEVDLDEDGIPDICFDSDNMWFSTTGELGIQTMWGPELFRLVVWI